MYYGLGEKQGSRLCCTPLNEGWQTTKILQPCDTGTQPVNLVWTGRVEEPPGELRLSFQVFLPISFGRKGARWDLAGGQFAQLI
jgi:hypothetical protein